MPLSRIEIEQLGSDRWVAEVEAGGTTARRKRVLGASFDQIVAAVVEAHGELTAPPAPKAATTDGLLVMRVPTGTKGGNVLAALGMPASFDDVKARETADDDAEPAGLDALREEAAALGVEVDGRWGERRLRHEIQTRRERS